MVIPISYAILLISLAVAIGLLSGVIICLTTYWVRLSEQYRRQLEGTQGVQASSDPTPLSPRGASPI